jgi:hypothetical protein
MRCWLVERDFDDKGLVRLVYATPDGSRQVIRERSAARLGRYDVTAAIDVEEDQLEPVDGDDQRERYAGEAERMAERHDPEDTL